MFHKMLKIEEISIIYTSLTCLRDKFLRKKFKSKYAFFFTYLKSKTIHPMLPNQWQSGNARKWKTGGVRFKPLSRLSTQPFGVLRGFLRNSRKYGLGSLRKTPTEGTSLVPQADNQPSTYNQPSVNTWKLIIQYTNINHQVNCKTNFKYSM